MNVAFSGSIARAFHVSTLRIMVIQRDDSAISNKRSKHRNHQIRESCLWSIPAVNKHRLS